MTESMPQVTIVYAILLILLGVGGYFVTGQASVTALIPAFFGLPVLLCGILARKEQLLRHAMHAAAMLGLIGFFGSVSGIPQAITLLTGGEVARPPAAVSKATMAVLSVIFVALCVNSFIQVRKARKAQGS